MKSEVTSSGEALETSTPLYDETIVLPPELLDGQRLLLHAERLQPSKEARQAQRAIITRRAVVEKKVIEVELWHEELVVEYVEGDGSIMLENGPETIVVQLRKEEVEVVKQLRLVEEVHITKRAVIETERFTGTVRQEVLRVEDQPA